MSTSNVMDLQEERNEILRIALGDLLVEMEDDRSFLDLVGLGQDLEELLHRKVDVLTDASLHPKLRQRILAEARPL